MTAAKVIDVIAGLPGCAGQAADAVSACTQGQNGRCTIVIENSNVRTSRYLDASTKTQIAKINFQHGRRVVPLERNLYGHPLAGLLWERHFEKVLLEHGWEKVQIGSAYLKTREKDYLFLSLWTTYNWLERNKTLTQCGKYLSKKSIWTSQHHSLTMSILVAVDENAKRAKILWTIIEICLNPKSLQDLKKSYFIRRHVAQTFPDGAMIWKVMQRNVWSDIANWRTEQLNSYTTSQLHALMTIHSKKKNWDLLENCQRYALKLLKHPLYLARIGRPDILWSVNKLARVIQTILSCGKYFTTVQTGTLSGL